MEKPTVSALMSLCDPIISASRNEYYTPPPELVTIAKQMNNGNPFCLDPCSCQIANRLHAGLLASEIYTIDDSGLDQLWRGNVFINPPYGTTGSGQSSQELWLDKAIHQYNEGTITSCLLLLTTAHPYDWFAKVMKLPHAYLKHKVRFYSSSGHPCPYSSPQSHVFVYLGPNVSKFVQVFSPLAFIPGANSWRLH